MGDNDGGGHWAEPIPGMSGRQGVSMRGDVHQNPLVAPQSYKYQAKLLLKIFTTYPFQKYIQMDTQVPILKELSKISLRLKQGPITAPV